MDGYSRIPIYKSTPVLRGIETGSVRSYDSHLMDSYTDPEDDDFGFKSKKEYALQRLFSRDANSLSLTQSMSEADRRNPLPGLLITSDSPRTIRKKRRAPDPPLSLVSARQKYPSSDNIVDTKTRATRTKSAHTTRPTSLSPNRLTTNLWNELLYKVNTQSPSPSSSPRQTRTKTILNKLRSPRITHKGSRRKRTTSKDDEEAGFKPASLSNTSSLDEADGFTEETLFFVILQPDLIRDVEFEVFFIFIIKNVLFFISWC